MTPRSVKGVSSNPFVQGPGARRGSNPPPAKKFKSSTVKGTKLSSGYNDRAQQRKAVEDVKEHRVKVLEEQMRLGKISAATFEALQNEIESGGGGAARPAKGLDWSLLERTRRGEDVDDSADGGTEEGQATRKHKANGADDDQAFDDLERIELVPVKRNLVEKKGEMAPPPVPKPAAGVKRSRNDILAEFRAKREAREGADRTAQKKGWKQDMLPGTSRIERDAKGREVLITVDEQGNVKRKVRKMAPPPPVKSEVDEVQTKPSETVEVEWTENTSNVEAEMNGSPGKRNNGSKRKNKPPEIVGDDANYVAVVQAQQKEAVEVEEGSDDDIFEGVGDDYDPLAGLEAEADNASSSDEDEEPSKERAAIVTNESRSNGYAASHISDSGDLNEEPRLSTNSTDEPSKSAGNRNYFGTSDSASQANHKPTFKDSELLAALKRASEISKREEAERKAKTAKAGKGSTAAERLLGRHDRDFEDMDMGFGESRGDDEEDDESGSRVKLSEWRGMGAEDDKEGQWQERCGQGQRKRGKKKKKGDKNSASDVLRIMEGNKK